MERWTELRTALYVAKLGTVSAASDALDIHRATVNRHIDGLEEELGTRIFIRHGRGYTLTEAGQDVLRVAQKTEDLLQDLSGRVQGQTTDIVGELTITTLPVFSKLLMEPIARFRSDHAACRVLISATEDLARLEFAEAHIALRAGPKPDNPDYVVQGYATVPIGLYAHQSYLHRYGRPTDPSRLSGHAFVGSSVEPARAPFSVWLNERISPEQLALVTENHRVREEAIFAGVGMGFLSSFEVEGRHDMVQIFPPQDDWRIPLWLVTHVDLHRTAKVQAMLSYIKRYRSLAAGLSMDP